MEELHDRERERTHAEITLPHQLKIGSRISIKSCVLSGTSDITLRHPELLGAEGIVCSIPVYPCTWVGVRLDSGSLVKLRSSNFDLKDKDDGQPIPVQTDRLRKSLFFNSLRKGDEILIMTHPTLRPRSGFPIVATVVQVPMFPR